MGAHTLDTYSVGAQALAKLAASTMAFLQPMSQEAMKFRLPTDQLQTIINALSPPKPAANVCL